MLPRHTGINKSLKIRHVYTFISTRAYVTHLLYNADADWEIKKTILENMNALVGAKENKWAREKKTRLILNWQKKKEKRRKKK